MRTDRGYRKLCKRYDELGHAHYLTFSCFHHQPFLKGDRSRRWLIEAVDAARGKYAFDLWAYVIMPDHVHLLVLPHEGTLISGILAGIKKPVAKLASNFVQREARHFIPRMLDQRPNGESVLRFWQRGGGYDRNMTSIEELHEKIRYIHNNPVRRELVPVPEDWPWSSYRAWELGVHEPLRIDQESLPSLDQR